MYKNLLVQHTPKQGDIDIYGVILYSDKHPNVAKVLADNDYWKALDAWSGTRWAVFNVKFVEAEIRGLTMRPEPPNPILHYVVRKEFQVSAEDIEQYEKSIYSPTLSVYAVDENGEVLNRELVIEDTSVDTVVQSLKTHMELVSNALKKIDSKNFHNTYGVMAAVNHELDDYRDWQQLKSGIKTLSYFKNAIAKALGLGK